MPTLLVFVMPPIIIGLLNYIFKNHFPKWLFPIVQMILLIGAGYFAIKIDYSYDLVPLLKVPLPYGMALKVDSLSAIMLLLNQFLFFVLTLYALKKPFAEPLFLFLFLSLQGLINGVFLSTDFFNVYILVEVATITASILVMYKKDSQSMYDGMIYLIANIIAMSFFLFGVGFLYKYYGVLDFETIKPLIQSESVPSRLYLPFAFLFTGVSLKAALMPLFSWLPKAHGTASAPSVVSAVLSGIFVKSGVYLLIRMTQIFSGTIDIQSLLFVLGFVTAIAGFIFAISQSDIKLILAYHTISQMGLILIGISGHNPLNTIGGVYHILSHGIFKSLLFVVAGYMISIFKTRNIGDMKGLWQTHKGLSIALLIAILSITGAPYFSGGYSKYLITQGYTEWPLKLLFNIINLGTMISFIKFIAVVVSHNPQARKIKIPLNECFALALFSIACVFLGLFGDLVLEYVFSIPFRMGFVAKSLKWMPYVMLYTFAFFIYKGGIKRSKLPDLIKKIEFTFNSISIAIAGYFVFTLLYLNILY